MCIRMLLLGVLLLGFQPAEAGIWDRIKNVFVFEDEPEPPTIRALIVKETPQVTLEVKGSFNVYDPYKNEKLSSRYSPKRATLISQTQGIKWGEEFVGYYQLKIVPDEKETSLVVGGIEYKGVLYVYDIAGKLSVINEVDMEEYVSSVLSVQIDHPVSKETMNALAIACRTDAYHQATHAQNPYWHVDATKTGYLGSAVKKRSYGVDRAVFDTRYMVLNQSTVYAGDQITTFPTSIVSRRHPEGRHNTVSISLDEVERLAQRGAPADRILTKFFPNTTISLTHTFDASLHNKDLADLFEE